MNDNTNMKNYEKKKSNCTKMWGILTQWELNCLCYLLALQVIKCTGYLLQVPSTSLASATLAGTSCVSMLCPYEAVLPQLPLVIETLHVAGPPKGARQVSQWNSSCCIRSHSNAAPFFCSIWWSQIEEDGFQTVGRRRTSCPHQCSTLRGRANQTTGHRSLSSLT